MPNPKNSGTRPAVAIVGAGITGLLVAHGLKKVSLVSSEKGECRQQRFSCTTDGNNRSMASQSPFSTEIRR